MSQSLENLIKFSRAITRRTHRARHNFKKVMLRITTTDDQAEFFLKGDEYLRIRAAYVDGTQTLITSFIKKSKILKVKDIVAIQTWVETKDKRIALHHEYEPQPDGQFLSVVHHDPVDRLNPPVFP